MVDTRECLVLAAHEVAVAAVPTMPAAAAEKPYADALAGFPPLHTRADCVDATYRLVTGDTRPLDWKHSFDGAGVRMADPARLNANADMAGVRIQQWLLGQFQLTRANRLYSAIRRSGLRHRNLHGRRSWTELSGLLAVSTLGRSTRFDLRLGVKARLVFDPATR